MSISSTSTSLSMSIGISISIISSRHPLPTTLVLLHLKTLKAHPFYSIFAIFLVISTTSYCLKIDLSTFSNWRFGFRNGSWGVGGVGVMTKRLHGHAVYSALTVLL